MPPSFGIRTLFADLDLHISDGEQLGLIGPNGAEINAIEGAGRDRASEGRKTPLLPPTAGGTGQSRTAASPPGLTVLEQVLEGYGAKRDLLLRFTAALQRCHRRPVTKHC